MAANGNEGAGRDRPEPSEKGTGRAARGRPVARSADGGAAPHRREVRLLGQTTVSSDGRRIDGDASPRALLLLAALALAAGRPLARGELAFRLWPESTDQQARTNLRKVVHELRSWLDDDWIEVDHRHLRLRNEHVVVDVDRFRSAVAARDDDAAMGVYLGPLLPGCWDDWVLEDRRVLDALMAECLRRQLARCANPSDRIDAAQRLLQMDPLDEQAHVALMRAHAESGNRSAALRCFDDCVEILERELGVGPSDEIVRAHASIQVQDVVDSGGFPSVPTPSIDPPLVGREQDVGWLQGQWAHAVDGAHRAVVVTGEAGVGKSRLVEEFARRCDVGGTIVLRSRAYESDVGRTLAPVVDWLRHDSLRGAIDALPPALAPQLGRLLPDHPEVGRRIRDPVAARARLFDAISAVLDATPGPLLLVLDDLQWCDVDTVDLVIDLVNRGPDAGLLVAATRRDHERCADPTLDRKVTHLRERNVLRVHAVSRLRPVHTAAIARAATDHEWSDEQVARLHVETDGHPLFVIEAARAGPHGEHLTPTVQGVIRRRLDRLTEHQRFVLDVAAVFGRHFGVEELGRACGSDAAPVVDAVDGLWRLGLVVRHGHGFDIGHDLVRETVLAAIRPARCQQLHRDVARALVEGAGDHVGPIADRLAEHYESAGLIDEAIDALALAGERAAGIGAHAQAIDHLERGLRLVEERPADAARDARELRLLTELGTARAVEQGYGSQDAQRAWDRAAVISHRLGTGPSGPVQRGLAMVAVADCRLGLAVGRAERLLHDPDPVVQVEGHYVVGVTRFWQGRFALADEHLQRAVDLYDPQSSVEHRALYGQDPKAVCTCRIAFLRALQGRAFEADDLQEQAEELAARLDDPLTRSYVWNYRVLLDRYLGRDTVHRPPEDPIHGFFSSSDREAPLWRAAWAGDREAEQELSAIADGWRRPGRNLLLPMWMANLAELRLRADDADRALVLLDEADHFVTERGQRFYAPELARLRAEALRSRGDPARSAHARRAVLEADEMGAAGLALRAATEVLRCTAAASSARALGTRLEALTGSHHGRDVDDAIAALQSFTLRSDSSR